MKSLIRRRQITTAPEGAKDHIETGTDGSETLFLVGENALKVQSAIYLDRDGDSIPEVARIIEQSGLIPLERRSSNSTLQPRIAPFLFAALAVAAAGILIASFRLYRSNDYLAAPMSQGLLGQANDAADSDKFVFSGAGHSDVFSVSNGDLLVPTATGPQYSAATTLKTDIDDDGLLRHELTKDVGKMLIDPAMIPETCTREVAEKGPFVKCITDWVDNIRHNLVYYHILLRAIFESWDSGDMLYRMEVVAFMSYTALWHVADANVEAVESTGMSLVERYLHGILALIVMLWNSMPRQRGLAETLQSVVTTFIVLFSWERYKAITNAPETINQLTKGPGASKVTGKYPENYFGPIDPFFPNRRRAEALLYDGPWRRLQDSNRDWGIC